MSLQVRLAEIPDDVDVILELARHHQECGESGLLDDSRARTELTDALGYYERVNALRPDDCMVAEAVAQLLLRLGRTEEAMLRLQPLATRSDPTHEALTGYFTCLFHHGHFGRLREACRLSGRRTDPTLLPNNAGEALRLWSGDAARPATPRIVPAGAPA
jgi:hypothetical protein